jgi:hypothetical protein
MPNGEGSDQEKTRQSQPPSPLRLEVTREGAESPRQWIGGLIGALAGAFAGGLLNASRPAWLLLLPRFLITVPLIAIGYILGSLVWNAFDKSEE